MSSYLITLLTTIGMYIILALGLNIIVGYAGQISLGHAAFWAIGAYSFAILTTKFSLHFVIAGILAILITAFIGVILGLPSLRVKEDFLAITTIGINFIVQAVFKYTQFFGGAMGIGGIPFPKWGDNMFTSTQFLILTYVLVVISIIVSIVFKHSWAGLASSAIKDDELASDMVGIDPRRFKILAFALGSAFAGIAGILYASFMGFISPEDFSFGTSIAILSMVMVGGEDTIVGPIFGAVLLISLPEIFRPIQDYRMLLYGGLLLIMMRFQPSGFFGKGGIVWNLIREKRS